MVALNELGREIGLIQMYVDQPMIQETKSQVELILDLRKENKRLLKKINKLEAEKDELEEMNDYLRSEIKKARKIIKRLLEGE